MHISIKALLPKGNIQGWASTASCGDWNLIFLDGEVTVNDFFSVSYLAARSVFIETCERAQAKIERYTNPAARCGNGGLTIDTAYLGAQNARSALVLVSGTHGVEGYCGSACQSAATSLGMWAELPPDSAVLQIHALNPYGFAYGRRVNEDNVDLNHSRLSKGS